MAEAIWEESEITVMAAVAGAAAKPYTKTVDLDFVKNGNVDAPLKSETGLTLTDNKLEKKYKTPKVADDEDTYGLMVIAKYGDGKANVSDVVEAAVWPKQVVIHAKDDKDRVAKQVPLRIVQNGNESAKPVTGDDGNATAELKEKAPYTIEALPPWSILEDVVEPAKKRDHKLKVQKRITAQFVSPDVTKDPYVPHDASAPEGGARQFVNLVTKTDGSDAMGNEVTFVVSAKPKEDGKKDDPIYIQVTFGKESSRNKPKPELLNNPAVSDLTPNADESVYTGFVKLDADGGTAKFKVNLGLAGLDSCTVAIGGVKDTYTDASITLVNWRKLWYEIRYPAMMAAGLSGSKDLPDDIREKLTARLGAAGIVFEKFKDHEFPDADATPAKKNGMIVTAAYLLDAGGGDRYITSSGILEASAKFSGDAATKSRSVYISLCDRAFTGYTTAHPMAPLVEAADFEVASPDDYFFEPNTKDGGVNLKVGSGYKWKAVVANAHNQATTLVFEPDAAPEAGGAVAGKVRVEETRRAGKTVDVVFPAALGGGYETSVTAGEKTKLDGFVAGLLTDVPALREAGNQVTLKLITDGSNADGMARFNAVKAAIQAKFTAVGSTINYHPGLDKNGSPREGAMQLAWLSFSDYMHVRVQLPVSPNTTPAHQKTLPGDFAGPAETDTQCKVQVKFDCVTAYEINGNSSGGMQILVLSATATPGAVASTVCHELGHSMGMTIVPGLANDLAPPGLTAKHIDNDGTSYVNGSGPYSFTDGKRNRHKGGHCAFSVPAADKAHETFNEWSPTADGCIMFGESGDADTNPAYCPTCLEIIKARRLEDIRGAWTGRGADQG